MFKSLAKLFSKKSNQTYDEIKNEKKKLIGEKIHKIFQGKVINGPYKNLKIFPKEQWSHDLGSKILGLYERQVQETIKNLCISKKINTIVNFGAAEGFHLTGLIKNKIIKKGFGVEINNPTINTLKKNIKLNKIESKIKIITQSKLNFLNKYLNKKELKKTLFLIDIEGGEYDLINSENIELVNKSYLLIEMHPFANVLSSKKKKFHNILKKYFKIKTIKNSERNPYMKKIESLSDDDRWLIISEGRPNEMKWLLCYPKKI
tara:strand:+ start:2643 stop:3425 length:783 start_codon:yes stop_codon:yes gene_type:complete